MYELTLQIIFTIFEHNSFTR